MEENQEKLVALFIDAENLIRPLEQRLERFNLDSILRRTKGYGVLILSRAYADWGYFPCRDFIRDFSLAGVEMTQVHSDFRGKNTADMQLSVDVMEHCQAKFAAEIIVLVSGDRDFVPLVQSLRRNGKMVICIGFDDTSNTTLQQICDVYISYQSLGGAAKTIGPVAEPESIIKPGAKTPPPPPPAIDPKEQAFTTLIEAINAIKRMNKPLIGGNANQVVRQLQPSFDFLALGYGSFKEFVEDAHKKGKIKMTLPASGIGDFTLDTVSAPVVAPEPALPAFDYNSTDEAVRSYRKLLAEKRVPLIPWKFRKPLLEHLWAYLEARGEVGAMGSELVDELRSFALENEWNVSEEQVFKLIYTLNLGFCFKVSGVAQRTQDIMNNFLTPSVELDQAFDFMQYVYLSGLKHADRYIKFTPEAVAELLFESRSAEDVKQAQYLIYGLAEWQRMKY